MKKNTNLKDMIIIISIKEKENNDCMKPHNLKQNNICHYLFV